MAKNSNYSLFINFFFNLLKKIGFHYSLFIIFLAHYSLFIRKMAIIHLLLYPIQTLIQCDRALKWPLSKRPKLVFKISRPIITLSTSKVLWNTPRGAFCNTSDSHLATICHYNICFVYFLRGHLRQVYCIFYSVKIKTVKCNCLYIINDCTALLECHLIIYCSTKN